MHRRTEHRGVGDRNLFWDVPVDSPMRSARGIARAVLMPKSVGAKASTMSKDMSATATTQQVRAARRAGRWPAASTASACPTIPGVAVRARYSDGFSRNLLQVNLEATSITMICLLS